MARRSTASELGGRGAGVAELALGAESASQTHGPKVPFTQICAPALPDVQLHGALLPGTHVGVAGPEGSDEEHPIGAMAIATTTANTTRSHVRSSDATPCPSTKLMEATLPELLLKSNGRVLSLDVSELRSVSPRRRVL